MAGGVEVGTGYLTVIPQAGGFGSRLSGQIDGPATAAGTSAGAKAGRGFGSRFASIAKSAVKVGVVGAVAIGALALGFARESIAEARESQKVGAITTQVIKSTGGAANVSAAAVGRLATAISNKTGVDDEQIQSGANMLLTFTNVRNEVGKGNAIFDRATKTVTDMSVALGQDTKNSAIQLGKALNDPIKGVTALQRVGVTFTTKQRDQIKALVESGNILGAQKIILGELNKEFGGAAAASSTAGEKMAVAFGNFKEQIGTALLPYLDRAEVAITSKVIPALSALFAKLSANDFAAVRTFFEGLNLDRFAGSFDKIKASLAGVGPSLKRLGSDSSTLNPTIERGSQLLGFFADHTDAVGKALPFVIAGFVAMKAAQTANNAIGRNSVIGFVAQTSATVAMAASNFALAGATRQATAAQLGQVAADNVGIVTKIRNTVATIASTVASRVAAGASKAWAAAQWLLNAALTANPVGLVIAAIALLVVGLVVAYKKSETFRSVVQAALRGVGAVGMWLWNSVFQPVIHFILSGFASIVTQIGRMLVALSHVPGFGWAKTAGEKMLGAASAAQQLADKIRKIPSTKSVTITVSAHVQTGRIKVGNEYVNVGQFAHGGRVRAGEPILVGERRPELFVPGTDGHINPMVGGSDALDLSEGTLMRLAAILARMSLSTTISAGSLDAAVGARL